jgi:hypothetical protein
MTDDADDAADADDGGETDDGDGEMPYKTHKTEPCERQGHPKREEELSLEFPMIPPKRRE